MLIQFLPLTYAKLGEEKKDEKMPKERQDFNKIIVLKISISQTGEEKKKDKITYTCTNNESII